MLKFIGMFPMTLIKLITTGLFGTGIRTVPNSGIIIPAMLQAVTEIITVVSLLFPVFRPRFGISFITPVVGKPAVHVGILKK